MSAWLKIPSLLYVVCTLLIGRFRKCTSVVLVEETRNNVICRLTVVSVARIEYKVIGCEMLTALNSSNEELCGMASGSRLFLMVV